MMITINAIGGATRFAAVVAEAALDPNKKPDPSNDPQSFELNASVASYLSLPGFNAPTQVDSSEASNTVSAADKASAMVKAVTESDDTGLKEALKQFDDGLKRLAMRPETQIFQAKYGLDNGAQENLVSPDPLPGVSEDGVLGVPSKEHAAADLNNDGKISEDERRRYQLPITYRSSERSTDALVDGPSAFSLTEANRAYGVVAAALA
ncbi:hypothetical protein [Burkholderia sp. LMU1-1-1.1]|jgi:hypothetical protein|uniref:hypothetical protein n=1 Tax=Burkholderia sp. LMU1-1-1.1 TaxID=3135266 RepID=UPI00343F748D